MKRIQIMLIKEDCEIEKKMQWLRRNECENLFGASFQDESAYRSTAAFADRRILSIKFGYNDCLNSQGSQHLSGKSSYFLKQKHEHRKAN